MSEFKSFKKRMQESFAKLVKDETVLFVTDIPRDLLWETYINGFEDPVEKQEHNCACCRSFIKNYANLVAIQNGKIVPIWNFECEDLYKPSVKALNELVANSTISNVFFTKDRNAGTDSNKERTDSGIITWDHFYLALPEKFVTRNSKSIESLMGTYRDNRNVFERSLNEITVDALETTLELIAQKSLYRGDEFKGMVSEFLKLKKDYDRSTSKENYCWSYSVQLPVSLSKIRNSAIGTLLTDLSEGKDLDKAVGAFERMVAPTNYKRPTALVTKSMIADAEKLVAEMGLMDSLGRRYANAEDISIRNLLFVNRDSAKVGGIFQQLAEDVIVNPKSLSKVEEIGINDFINNVLPNIKSVEVLLENNHINNLMNVITAKNEDAPTLFKWDNHFSWNYINAVTDSIKERVKAAGGKVDGVLRCSMQWNEDGKSNTDLDLHCYEPDGTHIYFGNCCGRGSKSKMSGNLDVDMRFSRETMVENMAWSNQNLMNKGTYKFWVKNYSDGSNTGFTIQFEFNGETFDLHYNKRLKGEVQIAEVYYDGVNFTLKSLIGQTSGNTVSKKVWNLDTNKFHKVSMIMNSPNHWTNHIGNRHVFFILENAKSEDEPRGFFNEFLKEELMANKRVFEVLGGKLKVEPADKELSGIGFSLTQRNSLIVKVEGKFTRTLKINF